MVTFDEFWQLLYDHGSSNYYKYDCAQIWARKVPVEYRHSTYIVSVLYRKIYENRHNVRGSREHRTPKTNIRNKRRQTCLRSAR